MSAPVVKTLREAISALQAHVALEHALVEWRDARVAACADGVQPAAWKRLGAAEAALADAMKEAGL